MTPRSIEYAVILDPELLRDRRQELGLTIREVSRRAELKGHSFLYALETGRRRTCSAELAWRIGAALRLTYPQIRRTFDFRTQARAA